MFHAWAESFMRPGLGRVIGREFSVTGFDVILRAALCVAVPGRGLGETFGRKFVADCVKFWYCWFSKSRCCKRKLLFAEEEPWDVVSIACMLEIITFVTPPAGTLFAAEDEAAAPLLEKTSSFCERLAFAKKFGFCGIELLVVVLLSPDFLRATGVLDP